jgi:hypothetical protein
MNRATLMGKILLFVNLAFSLALAFWGFGIYTNHIDWSDQKVGERMGQFAIWNERIKSVSDLALPRAMSRFQTARAALEDLEARRPKLREWYARELQNLQSGNQAVRAPVYRAGQLQIDPKTGAPVMGPVLNLKGQPIQGLASIEAQNKTYMEKQSQIVAVTKEIDKLLTEEKRLTTEIGDGKEKGLRADLASVQLARQRSEDEQEFLRPLLYNRQVEVQILVKRQKALEARLKELGSVSVARD